MDIQKLREALTLDALILFSPQEILAATDIFVDKACLIADPLGITMICPEGAAGDAAHIRWEVYPECGFNKVQHGKKNLWAAVEKYLHGRKRIGYVRYTCPAALMDLSLPGAVFTDISGPVAEAMLCKNDVFFEKYERIRQLNIQAYEAIRSCIHAGCSEMELYAVVRKAYVQNCGTQVLHTGDFLSGPRTCQISGPPTDRRIQTGDTIIADTLCASAGVYCDTTRTFFCGEPDTAIVRAYETLCQIHKETAPLLRPGTAARDIYRFVSERLMDAGYDPLPHHAGHGLGYSWYEAPYLISDDTMPLKENMLIALEPGIYIPGKHGLRLENNYRVTGNGGVDVFCYTQNIKDFII